MLLLFITTLSLSLSFYRIENIIITIIIYILITQSFIAKSSYLSNICMYVCIKLQPIVCEIASFMAQASRGSSNIFSWHLVVVNRHNYLCNLSSISQSPNLPVWPDLPSRPLHTELT